MSTLTRMYVKHVLENIEKSITLETISMAKSFILHTLSCSYSGHDSKCTNSALKIIKKHYRSFESIIWFNKCETNPLEAGFVNSIMAQIILHEDIHRNSNTHPGIIVIPCALSIGEYVHANGNQIIRAIISGYEIIGKFGKAASTDEFAKRGYRPTSIIGSFGSCVVAGLLMGLTENELVNAIGLTGNLISGVNEWAYSGTDDLFVQNGAATRNGILAAYFAKEGFESSDKILEGNAGICNAYGLSAEKLATECKISSPLEISNTFIKKAPACALVQTTAQIAFELIDYHINIDDILYGVINTFYLSKHYPGCDNPGPFSSSLQARMSNQYNLAAILKHKKIANDIYYDYDNPDINLLSSKLTVYHDKKLDEEFPLNQPVDIYLKLKNGKIIQKKKNNPVYLNNQEIMNNFINTCSNYLSNSSINKAIELVEKIEKLDDINELTNIIR